MKTTPIEMTSVPEEVQPIIAEIQKETEESRDTYYEIKRESRIEANVIETEDFS